MGKSIILCCGAQGWTRFIGWLCIFGSSFGILISLFYLQKTLPAAETDEPLLHPHFGYWHKDHPIRCPELAVHKALVLGSVSLVVTLLFLISTVMLLNGTYTRQPRLLCAWLIISALLSASTLIFYVVALASGMICPRVARHSPYHIMAFLATQVFFAFVVYVHKIEMESSSRAYFPGGSRDL